MRTINHNALIFNRRNASTIALLLASYNASAIALYREDSTTLNADVLAVYGFFDSQQNYYEAEGGSRWREGFIKYGLSGEQILQAGSSLSGAVNLVSSGVWGDGDAVGLTDGSERTTALENAYLTWKSGDLLQVLGNNGLELSAGRQVITVGDGFLINGDDVNLGNTIADGAYNRGGVYYLGARHAFDKTLVVRLGGDQGWRGDAIWLKSDNRFQGNTELAIGTLEHVTPEQTFGLTYIHANEVNEFYTNLANPLASDREGMDVYSLRGVNKSLVNNLTLSFEYAHQENQDSTESGWYGEASYAFADSPWSPTLTYRYSRFSERYDALFYGFNRGFGTWVQGEVAGNFSGPYNNNAAIQHVGLKLQPREDLSLGMLFFDFRTLNKENNFNLDGQELDIYADWSATSYLQVTPMLGLYNPKKSFAGGGAQSDDSDLSVFTGLTLAVYF